MADSRPLSFLILFLVFNLSLADDVSHDDDSPKSPACSNRFQLVKVKTWVNGDEEESVVGLSARFGAPLPSDIDKALRLPASLTDPPNCCTNLSLKLSNKIALSERGDCTFTAKAQVAQSAGASGLLVINDKEDLYKMVCTENDTSLNITIPVVMIPKSDGDNMKNFLAKGKVELLLYAPNRPVVDFSEIFLWLMAVGTIICATLWEDLIACEQNDERYNELTKDSANAVAASKDEPETVDINAKGAIVFVISASVFLLLLYFFMSSWFIWLLIILFCIGGTQGMHVCFVALISRICRNCGRKTINFPLIGEATVLSTIVLLFCVAFAIFWAANQHASYAWIGQDVLGICLMITVLQMTRLPNIKVAAVLLCCAFFYDIFWVFISPLIFHDSTISSPSSAYASAMSESITSPPPTLSGRVAIVTGASRGIGRAIALHLASLGASLVINYASNATQADDLATQINSQTTASPPRATSFRANISNSAEVKALFDHAQHTFGAIHILVNCAGVLDPHYPTISETSEQVWDNTFEVNTKGAFLCCREAAARVVRGGSGRIITMSSSMVGGLRPGYGAYAASKAATETLIRILAKELKGTGITANAVAPGPIATEMFFAGKSEEAVQRLIDECPLSRLGETKDVVGVVGFLAGDSGEWVNGQVIRVNGGYV